MPHIDVKHGGVGRSEQALIRMRPTTRGVGTAASLPLPAGVCLTLALFHLVCYAFGAPLLTVHKSAAVYTSVSMPLFITTQRGSALNWLAAPADFVRRRLLPSLLGVYLGAFVCPLDWAVWWQEWPLLSCALGATFALVSGFFR
jgi:hypothetical protein